MNRLFVIAGLAILVVALVFLNQGINKTGLSADDNTPPPAQTKAAAAPSAKTPSNEPPPPPAELSVGNPATAKHHILVGWSYTDANQQKPEALAQAIQAIMQYAAHTPGLSVEIVNVDVPAADRSPAARTVPGNGVFVDGKSVFQGDISAAPPMAYMGAIQAHAR